MNYTTAIMYVFCESEVINSTGFFTSVSKHKKLINIIVIELAPEENQPICLVYPVINSFCTFLITL